MNNTPDKVAIVGLWRQGVVAAACLAEWGYNVTAADSDADRVRALQRGEAPVYEPGLDELVRAGAKSGRLTFLTKAVHAVSGSPVVWLASDTPVNHNDESNLAEVFRCITEMAPGLIDSAIVVVSAQVPVGTCDALQDMLRQLRPEIAAHVACVPENLEWGQALDCFRAPSLPVIGAAENETFQAVRALLAPCRAEWQRCDLRTAEMAKHGLDSFRALSIAWANEFANLCERIGVDAQRVLNLLRIESPRSLRVTPALGMSWACGHSARDVQTLRRLGTSIGHDTPLLDGVWMANQLQKKLLTRRLADWMGGSLAGRRIAVWGLTCHPGTSALHRSPSLELIGDLHRAGAEVLAHDPQAARMELDQAAGFTLRTDRMAALDGAEALVLMTPWPEYRDTDFDAVRRAMKGLIVFDTARLWTEEQVARHHLHYYAIGGGRPDPEKTKR